MLDFDAYLNVKNAIYPGFGTEGKRLLLLSDITGTYQVWAVNRDGKNGWPEQLTFFSDRVTGLHPSPDNNSFLLTRDRGGDEQDQFYLLEGDTANGISITPLLDTPQHKNNFGAWRADGKAFCFSSNRRHPAFFDIYTQEIGGEPGLVYQDEATLYVESWSGDQRYILFRRANTNLDFDLFLLDLANPATAPRHLTPHEGAAVYSHAQFSPNNDEIFLSTNLGRSFSGPACLKLDSGKITFLSDKLLESEGQSLSPDGTKLLYELNQDGYSRLFVLDLASSAETEIAGLPKGVALGIGLFQSVPVWSPDGKFIAFSFSSHVQNADIWVYSLDSGELNQVTFSPRGGLNFTKFVESELIYYPSFDGLQIPAMLFRPPAKKSGLPFIVYVHGGPESQTRFSWNPVLQYYVARGYGILAPNVRGSSGYGREYLAKDDIRKRMDSVADLKAGVEWLRETGYADATRIAVYGQSYGGFMVLAAVTTYPELWAAGVDIYGIANMLTFMENTSPYRLKLRTPEYGDPVVDRDFLIEISPIHKVDRITAPMMVVHGARDPRVPLVESEQMVAALEARQHPVEFLVLPDEGHGITRLANKLVVFPAIGDFLDKYLMGNGEE